MLESSGSVSLVERDVWHEMVVVAAECRVGLTKCNTTTEK